MKILIADKFEKAGVEALQSLGHTVVSDPDLGPDTLSGAVTEHDPDILIVRSTKVPEPVFDAAKSLSLVIRAGAGYDTIDVGAASKRAISVANCPGKNSVAVAELTWGLITALDRKIPQPTSDLREGKWDKKGYGKASGLKGRTLGVIGPICSATQASSSARPSDATSGDDAARSSCSWGSAATSNSISSGHQWCPLCRVWRYR